MRRPPRRARRPRDGADAARGRGVSTAAPAVAVVRAPRSTSFWAIAGRRFLRHRLAVVGLVALAAVGGLAVFAPLLAPHGPTTIDPAQFQAPPSGTHPLGTDSVGRDVLSRLLYAGRVSLTVGLLAVAIYVVLGTVIGALAGYHGGTVDTVLSRLTDVVLSFPPLIIILFAVSIFGRPSLANIIIVLGNAALAAGNCVIGHAVMQDAIDGSAVIAALRQVGLFKVGLFDGDVKNFGAKTPGDKTLDASRIVNVLAKADPSPNGLIRGWRHTMLDDTDISATRHVRAAVGGVIAGLTGCPALFVSGGAEHQGPPGGGPVAVIAKL